MTAAIVVVAALVLVPGAGASLALARPGAISIESRIALAFGLGYGLVAAIATLLALAHVFSLPAFVAAVVLATAAVWALALRRAAPRSHAAALLTQAREAPFALGAGLVLLVAFAVTRAFYPVNGSLGIRSSWRYWADGLELAAAGHVPGEAAQWGIEIPTTVSKVALNAFEGGVSFLLGPGPLAPMQAILIVSAIGLVAALLALGRELGLGIFAPLVPVLVVLVPEGFPLSQEASNDLRFYTAEGIGRMAAYSALLIGMYAVRVPERRAVPVVAGALLAVAGLTHLVPTLVAGALLALYVLGTVLVDRSGLRRVAATAGIVAAVFGLSYVGTLVLSGGDLGLQRATSGAAFTEFPPNVDPTRSFTHGELVERRPTEGGFLIPPRELLLRYGEEAVERPGRPDWGKVGLLALAALGVATAAMLFLTRSFFVLAVMAWGLAATTLVVAFLFSYRYSTVIPANFGVRRLYDYVGLTPALLVPALLETATRGLTRRNRLALAGLALVTGVLAVGAAVDRVPRDRSPAGAAAGVAVFKRVADNVPCGARMLANARTAGSWQAWTGRRAVTEGMSPFLRPQVMERIFPILSGANEFFRDPQANRSFLEREDVEYLVVVEPGVSFGWGGTGRGPKDDDAAKVAALADVQPVYRDRRVSIFAVGSTDAAPGRQPRRCPL